MWSTIKSRKSKEAIGVSPTNMVLMFVVLALVLLAIMPQWVAAHTRYVALVDEIPAIVATVSAWRLAVAHAMFGNEFRVTYVNGTPVNWRAPYVYRNPGSLSGGLWAVTGVVGSSETLYDIDAVDRLKTKLFWVSVETDWPIMRNPYINAYISRYPPIQRFAVAVCMYLADGKKRCFIPSSAQVTDVYDIAWGITEGIISPSDLVPASP